MVNIRDANSARYACRFSYLSSEGIYLLGVLIQLHMLIYLVILAVEIFLPGPIDKALCGYIDVILSSEDIVL